MLYWEIDDVVVDFLEKMVSGVRFLFRRYDKPDKGFVRG
jgi:hypothetical protein